jgi:hypothetical protein
VPGELGGWDNADPDDDVRATAFIIEWSKDRFTPPKATAAVPAPDLANLRNQTAAKMAKKRATHAKMLLKNGQSMNLDLENWYNKLSNRVKGRYFNPVQSARKKIQKSGRINEKGPFPPLPAGIGDQCNAYLGNQRKLDAQYQQSLERDRDDYLKKMKMALKDAQAGRLLDQIDPIEEEIEAIGEDAESFLDHLMPEEE